MNTDKDQIDLDFTSDVSRLTFDGPIMTPEEAMVWAVLRYREGKARAILGPEIAELTEIPYKRVQKIVSNLVTHHRKLIGSGTCGYWIPVTPEEVADAAHYLRHRAIVALARASEMQHLSLEEVFGQAKMEFRKAG